MPKRAMELLTESMFYVLMALREGEMCGADAAEYIARCTGGRVQPGPATLYTILAKFEKEKYIRETAVDGRKRTYAITERGLPPTTRSFCACAAVSPTQSARARRQRRHDDGAGSTQPHRLPPPALPEL